MVLKELGSAKYVNITTYRKDGSAVATPVWVAPDGEKLIVWTRDDSWKVKRIKRDPRVEVAACDARGRVKEGAARAHGAAEVLPKSELTRARKLLSRKYTWQFWLLDTPATLFRRGKRPHVAISIALGAKAEAD
ncbi:PPOX class F420-dependent oxidoreductase [Streptomyces tsukubensis]|uniref:PPOX class F420-dependent enzyme n=1 Tax=Streptomyces tsukubensis TaxID=83656 RepID=A0A1V4AEE6_9ACTN|nr:PPOX class F420-dependent oxidoreductase [Streptomyces tsukubensis]OON81711.1 PPOX class F420-dependent enzyme [Streptomyces tsukubensis]QFR96489.1 PPOX class F420-dependent oxidoreductase [Streptomyces tsukubensis]